VQLVNLTEQEKFDMGLISNKNEVKTQKATQPKVKNLDPLHSAYSKCIDVAVQAGRITKGLGQSILNAENPEEAITNLVIGITREKREKAIQAVRIAQGYDLIKKHGSGDALTGLMAIMVKDITNKGTYLNIDLMAKGYNNKFNAKWAESLSIFRTRMFGLSQDQESLDLFVGSVYGKLSGDAEIDKAAKDWLEIVDDMNNEFNRNGGSISKNENWLLPQHHDLKKVRGAGGEEGYKAWRTYVDPLLNKELMTDDAGRVLSENNFEEAMRYAWESISTGGLNKAKDFTVPNLGVKLARKNSQARFLYFKDSESWLAYQNDYGKGDVLTTLTDHINSVSHDTALMRVFGTNPKQTFEILKTEAQKLNRDRGIKARENLGMLDAVYKVVSGDINGGNLVTLADGMQAFRNVQVFSKLGGAALSSVTDIAATAITANYNGMNVGKVWARQISLMNPTNEADRIFAGRMGLIFDTWIGRAHGGNRFTDVYGTGNSMKIAEATLRMSGLEAWTESGRKAFGMEFAGMLGDNFGKTFDQLDPALQRAMKLYQITVEDWNAFRASDTLDLRGSKFADLTKDDSMKFSSMILAETDYAVPTPDARVRAIATGGLERNTGWGQIARSAMMIKSFPITMLTTHLYRGAMQGTIGGRGMYLGSLGLSMTLMGGFALQIKDLAAGRNPRPMDNTDFWKTAFVQGGSGSLFADYVVSDVNKYGSNFITSLVGPFGGFANDTYELTKGTFNDIVAGDQEHLLGNVAGFLKKQAPDPWPVQLFTNYMWDSARLMADPSYQGTMNRIRRKRKAEFGQDYWWEQGESPLEAISDL
jgi:hypothetical protein